MLINWWPGIATPDVRKWEYESSRLWRKNFSRISGLRSATSTSSAATSAVGEASSTSTTLATGSAALKSTAAASRNVATGLIVVSTSVGASLGSTGLDDDVITGNGNRA